jgi:hypothetical protein
MNNAAIIRIGCLAAMILGVVVVATTSAQQVYAPPVAGVRAYAYVPYPYAYYTPRRAVRQAVRYGYAPAAAIVVRGPSDFFTAPSYRFPYYGSLYFGYPYYGSLKPPIGYGSGADPGGSMYRSGHGQPNPGANRAGPSAASQIPPPPAPQRPSALPGEMPLQLAPRAAPDRTPVPETIPTPPSELGPREF